MYLLSSFIIFIIKIFSVKADLSDMVNILSECSREFFRINILRPSSAFCFGNPI